MAEIFLNVIDHSGKTHCVEALVGWRVMEIIRDWDLRIKAECGGAGACGSCHVHVDPAFAELFQTPSHEELEQLDALPGVTAQSRLSCQLLMRPECDGMTVRLAPGSELDLVASGHTA